MVASKPTRRLVSIVLSLLLVATSCGGDDGLDREMMVAAVENYASGVHSSYQASLGSAVQMDAAIDAFVSNPSDDTLEAARQAWLDARDDYGPTEAFRFYGGPIDDETDGLEGLINAWPLDEAYIDYVEGNETSGVINDATGFPVLDAELLLSLNEQGGEANISTGWHAIEFLLWGQDLSVSGAGDRPVSDYVDAPNADRRGQYLVVASDLLVEHLSELVEGWAPSSDNYRREFEAVDPAEALRRVITGIGELSRGELAGERMNVAYAERSQEDEHSCFSDNTTNDIIGNARGIEMVLTGEYPGGVSGVGLIELVGTVDQALSDELASEIGESLTAVEAIPAPFDQHLIDGVSDDDPGRMAVLTAIEHLEDQTDTIVDAATALGITINVT